jgi:hypothetical protein
MTTGNTALLGLALPVQGELAGTWGTVVNTSITSLIDSAIAGTTTLSTDADVTLTTTALAANQARQAILLWTASNGATTRNITAPAQSKPYIVINAGTGSIVLRGAGPTTGVTILAGEKCMAAWNGSDFVKIGTAASSVTYTPAGTGAVTTDVQTKLRETVSVKDFGAVGDGVTNATSAIQAAIDACFTSGQTVYVDAGTYAVTSIKIYPNTILEFDANATFKQTANGFAIRTSTSPSVTVPNTSVRYAKIYNAQINMNSCTGAAIFLEGAQSCVVDNAVITNVGSGTFTYDDGVTNNANYRTSAIMIKGITGVAGPYYNQINHCRASGGGSSSTNSGIWLGTTIGSTDNQRANLNQVNQCVFTSFGEGISMWVGSDNRFIQPEVSSCGTGIVVGNTTLYTLNSNGNSFQQVYAESCTTGMNLTTLSLDTTIFGFSSLSGTTTGLVDNGERTYVAELRATSQIANTPRSYPGGLYYPNLGTATTGTSTSTLMGYYDTGTFTPILADNQTGGNVATFLYAYGLYTRIGNRVFVTISLTDITTTGMTAGNQVFIRGLPWDVNSNTLLRSAGAVSFSFISTTTGCISARAIAASNYISLFEQTTTGQATLLVSQLTSGSTDLFIELSYQV